ncbi:MAG: amidohydrolase [Rhodospirillales bacterium]|nr:amidohydrolase [Rhodospirillales bacterium]
MSIVISADEHLVEPPEFWSDLLPASLPAADRDLAPRLEGGALVVDGQSMPVFLLFPELIAYSDAQPGVGDLAGRLAVMDSEGIDVSILFPQRAMGMYAIKDPALRTRCINAYNEWLSDFCAKSSGRLQGVAILPTVYQPEACADYLAHLKSLGFGLFMMPGALRGTSYTAPEMSPLWSAIEESGLVTAFHTSETPEDNGPGGLGTFLTRTSQPFRNVWAHFVFTGLLERHPAVRLLFAEGGISWIPSALEHADRIHDTFADYLNPRLPRPPSEYWFGQCWATFMDDPRGLEQIDYIGADHVLWSSDYPHPEGTSGRTRDLVSSLRGQLGPQRAAQVLGGNAAALLGLNDRLAA